MDKVKYEKYNQSIVRIWKNQRTEAHARYLRVYAPLIWKELNASKSTI